jgi:hypothetical protein
MVSVFSEERVRTADTSARKGDCGGSVAIESAFPFCAASIPATIAPAPSSTS